jgi:predicted AlkP superfamily pyrophosphatase or phosphodiesterase
MKMTLLLSLVFLAGIVHAQISDKPKLIVGIVVDQMVYDYLYRYESRFSKGGFELMKEKGTNCRNTQYNYVPTYTGPGHASIYTGATPNDHGIVANQWYSREQEEMVNCVGDSNYFSVGTESNDGVRSPKNLKCMTITDQLKMTYPESKVVAISFKDRGAILPGGHLSDGSYWFDYVSGNMITSDFYTKELPAWVSDFNSLKIPQVDLKKTWTTLYPLDSYRASGPDNSPYEKVLNSKSTPTFPYNLPEIAGGKKDFHLFAATPFANTFLTDFSIQALENESLGKGEQTDILCVSYSTPDIAGHAFGPRSVEIEDMYLRLDRDIEKLIKAIKKQVGKDFVMFLTADHAVVPVPQMLMDKKLPGGYLFSDEHMINLHDAVKSKFGTDFVAVLENNNIYLNEELINFMGANKKEVEEFIAEQVTLWPGVKQAYTSKDLQGVKQGNHYTEMVKKGYDRVRSGNVIFILEPGYLAKEQDRDQSRQGTSHGTGYAYDTHVPLLWYGKGIKEKDVMRKVDVTDIVPTLTHILELQYPNCATGTPILELFQK